MEQNMTQVAQAMLNNMSVADSLRFEMLNFAVTGYHPPEQVKVTEKVIEPFDLDALILTAHTDELQRIKRNLYHIIDKGYHQNYPTLNQIVEEAGLQSLPDRMTFDRKITPFLPEVYSWALQRIASQCKDAGVLPVLAYLFVPESNNQPEEEFEKLSKIAAAEGFITINLHKYVDDMKEEDLKIAPWDGHLSLQAHQRYGVGLAKEIAKILNTTE